MRAFSFLLALIAIACGGAWYWLSQQDAVTSNSAPQQYEMVEATAPAEDYATESAPMDDAFDDSSAAMMDADDLFDEDGNVDIEALNNLPATAAGGNAQPAQMNQNRFSPQSTPDAPIVAERSVQAATPSELDNFKSRPIAYNRPPEVLALGKAVDVSLIIDATSAANPAAGLEGFEGEIVERDVVLSDEVAAQLTGAAFEIELMSVSRQILSSRAQNRWHWRITPVEEGEHMLILEIFGYAQGSNAAEPLDAYRDRISVEVKQLDKIVTLAKDYEPVIGAIGGIAGMFSALFAFIRFSSNRKKKKKA
ncbi:hypothetical protein [Hirschia baltica]|uniref:Uncharacterized protein n=1 Tax=Hirschia baltica (strain ATCC 49814 / DSM 5838 / IFAM 1418) TaxID=582402 RepID=C6XI29_HIRBI|nr:hypothetical protein [Hirschia baltica]ACT58855.1 hypothetical protein Hbal_1163 [Hirschia baltica ATCC 49814]